MTEKEARRKYDKIAKPARAAYDEVVRIARAKFEMALLENGVTAAIEAAEAEYQRETDPAWDLYLATIRPAGAEYMRAIEDANPDAYPPEGEP